jgi:hypothetical protein
LLIAENDLARFQRWMPGVDPVILHVSLVVIF